MTATSVVTTLLWNALEASMLTIVLVGFLKWRKISAPFRHLLWLLVLTKLFVPTIASEVYGLSGVCHGGWQWLSRRLEITIAREGLQIENEGDRVRATSSPADGPRDDGAFSRELLGSPSITRARAPEHERPSHFWDAASGKRNL